MNPDLVHFINRYGLFACCVAEAVEQERAASGQAAEGAVLVCSECGTEMVVHERRWQWKELVDDMKA